ncbi:MAG TPA: GtrA family protein [Terriglobales bacterium]|jgi:putative flippase GtrA
MMAWPSSAIRWAKFNAVGGLGIGVQLCVLGLSTRLCQLNYLAATAVAVEAAIIHNYLWHDRFTWSDRPSDGRVSRFMKFNLTTGALSILGNLAFMRVLVGLWNIPYLRANLITIGMCSIANFLISDHIVFKEADRYA